MNISDITGIVSSIGFPIAMCIILVRYIQTTQKDLIIQMGEISKAIAILCDKVGRHYGDKDED